MNYTKSNFTAPESKLYKEVKMNKPGPNAAMTNVGQVILTLSKRTYQRFWNPLLCYSGDCSKCSWYSVICSGGTDPCS